MGKTKIKVNETETTDFEHKTVFGRITYKAVKSPFNNPLTDWLTFRFFIFVFLPPNSTQKNIPANEMT